MENNKIAGSKLFVHTSVDFRDELEEVGVRFGILEIELRKVNQIPKQFLMEMEKNENRRETAIFVVMFCTDVYGICVSIIEIARLLQKKFNGSLVTDHVTSFKLTPNDCLSKIDKNCIFQKYERAHHYLQTITVGLSDKEFHDTLQGLVCKHDKHHEDISLGLVYNMLTEATAAPKTYRDLTLITRDGLAFVINNLSVLVVEKYQKLSDVAKKQLIWLMRELVKNQVQTVDNLVWNVLRQASGGDISSRNLALIEGLLDIFIEYRAWLDNVPIIISAIIYTYVRLLEDHAGPQLTALRNKEVKFVISLIRERFLETIALGRDFVRLVLSLA